MWAATLHAVLGEHIVTVSAIIDTPVMMTTAVCCLFFTLFPLHSHPLRPESFTEVSQMHKAKPRTGHSRDSISELLTPASAFVLSPALFPLLYDN